MPHAEAYTLPCEGRGKCKKGQASRSCPSKHDAPCACHEQCSSNIDGGCLAIVCRRAGERGVVVARLISGRRLLPPADDGHDDAAVAAPNNEHTAAALLRELESVSSLASSFFGAKPLRSQSLAMQRVWCQLACLRHPRM